MQIASRAISVADREKLRSHIVNLRQGRFSTDGDFVTTQQDVEAIFATALPAALAEAKGAGSKLRLLFYAHGGLVSESNGIDGALSQIEFWKANHVYPIFFIWETGILEVLADLLRKQLTGMRGLMDFAKDATAKVLESVARPGGLRVWGNMKLSAQAASAADGGARVVADLASQFVKANLADMEVHAIGHSAGSIFHSFFLPELVKAGVPLASLSLLAPAVNIPTFKAHLMPLAGKGIASMTMLTMHREFERADTAGPYPKSLLYLVHHSFEDPDETPILGLEENITRDAELTRLFGQDPNAIVYSVTKPEASNHETTRAIHHGDFDNDPPTMNSVCRRILGVGDSTAISNFPEGTRSRTFDPLEALQKELIAAGTAGSVSERSTVTASTARTGFGATNARGSAATPGIDGSSVATPIVNGSSGGKRIALCIGIDAYPEPHTLSGCVNDSRDWEKLFRSMGYKVGTLRDDAATRSGITDALSDHVSRLQAGDVFLFQYSGHGTQFDDDSGDEADGQDEALCPFDMMTAGFVRDDDIRLIVNRVPPGALAVGFIDCCHSGSIARMIRFDPRTRALNDSRPRAIDPTPEMIRVHRRTRTRGRVLAPSERRDITFAACRDDQVAFETGNHGDYTTRVVPLLTARANGLTNLGIQKLIQAAFGAGARQNPMLDCDASAENRPFLRP